MDSDSAPPAADKSPPPLRIGLMLFHGMGKQRRYGTLTEITQAVQCALGIDANSFKIREYTHRGYQDQQVRLSATLSHESDGGASREVEINLFEMYWSPLVRGAVGLFDVLLWLAGSAFAAIRKLRGMELKADIEQLQERYREVAYPRREVTHFATRIEARGRASRNPYQRVEQLYQRAMHRLVTDREGRARKFPAWFGLLYWLYNFCLAVVRFLALFTLVAFVFGPLTWLMVQLGIGIVSTCGAVAAAWPQHVYMRLGAFHAFWLPLIYFLLLCVCVNGLAIVLRASLPVQARPLPLKFSQLNAVLVKILTFAIELGLVVVVSLVCLRVLVPLLVDTKWIDPEQVQGLPSMVDQTRGFATRFWNWISTSAVLAVLYVVVRSYRAGWQAALERGIYSLVLAAAAIFALVMTYRLHMLWDLAAVLLPLVIFLWVRLFLVEWMGDVLLMTDANETAKTYTLRRRVIRYAVERLEYLFGQEVCPRSRAAGPGGVPVYEGELPDFDRVIVAGHSLGTYVAYLGLCEYFGRLREMARLNRGEVPAGGATAPDYLGRFHRKFCLFLTYGSPLDRIRFFFDPGSSGNEVTDALRHMHQQHKGAHSDTDKAFSGADWLNLYCWTDAASTRLARYGALVQNRHIASLLWPPIICHSFYLADPFVLRILRGVLTGCAAEGRSATA